MNHEDIILLIFCLQQKVELKRQSDTAGTSSNLVVSENTEQEIAAQIIKNNL